MAQWDSPGRDEVGASGGRLGGWTRAKRGDAGRWPRGLTGAEQETSGRWPEGPAGTEQEAQVLDVGQVGDPRR